jgi:Telomere resolvase
MKNVLAPQEYFDKIKPLRTSEEIKELCDRLTRSLFNETDKPKTRVNKLIPYNKVIKEGFSNDELIEGENAYIQTKADGSLWKRHLHFQFTGLADTKWHGEGGINTKTIVLDRLENRREVNVTSYLNTVSKLLLSDDPHELAVGLIAASGRRPVEIADDYEEIKQLQKDWELPNQQTVVHNLIELAKKTKQLENQLLETQSQITQLQQEKLEMQSIPPSTPQSTLQSQPQSQDLQAMVKQMVAEALTEALPQIQQLTPNIQQPTPLTQRQPKAKPETPDKDWESVTSEELKASKHRGAAEEKIKRSFWAIANHNDHKAKDNNGQPDIKQMWAVTNQALRQVSGCNGQLVKDWMESHHGAINDHNAKYGLGQYHNKGKGDITLVIKW